MNKNGKDECVDYLYSFSIEVHKYLINLLDKLLVLTTVSLK